MAPNQSPAPATVPDIPPKQLEIKVERLVEALRENYPCLTYNYAKVNNRWDIWIPDEGGKDANRRPVCSIVKTADEAQRARRGDVYRPKRFWAEGSVIGDNVCFNLAMEAPEEMSPLQYSFGEDGILFRPTRYYLGRIAGEKASAPTAASPSAPDPEIGRLRSKLAEMETLINALKAWMNNAPAIP